jgi:hypothetical protein
MVAAIDLDVSGGREPGYSRQVGVAQGGTAHVLS